MTPTERHNLIDARRASIADRLVEARAQYALDGLQQWAELRQVDQHEGALYRLEAYASMRAPLKGQS